jgi:hypothetical protein
MKRIIIFLIITVIVVPACGCIFGGSGNRRPLTEEELAQAELKKRQEAVAAHEAALRYEPVQKERFDARRHDAALITPEEETRLRELADLADVDARLETVRNDSLASERRIEAENRDRARRLEYNLYTDECKIALAYEEARSNAAVDELKRAFVLKREAAYLKKKDDPLKEGFATKFTLSGENYGPGSKDSNSAPSFVGEIPRKKDVRTPLEKLLVYQVLVTIKMIPNTDSATLKERPQIPVFTAQHIDKDGKILTKSGIYDSELLVVFSEFTARLDRERNSIRTQVVAVFDGPLSVAGFSDLIEIARRAKIYDVVRADQDFKEDDR